MGTSTLLDLIGNTPLVQLPRLSPKPGIRIFAKLEGQNPSGSIKDRIALGLVESAERQGHLRAGSTIVEASSGNTAIAAALVGKQKGYQVELVIPTEVAPSIEDVLALYGVTITWCKPQGGMTMALKLAKEKAESFGYHLLGQFTNAVNVDTHYNTTGAEIVSQLATVDAFVAGIGTGGTIMGVGKRLREANPNVRVIGVEPYPGERLHGIRSLSEGFIPPLFDLKQLDGRFLVDSANAFKNARMATQQEGIVAGVSSGATLSVALRLADKMERGNIVVMFADGGWKYLPAKPWNVLPKDLDGLDNAHWW